MLLMLMEISAAGYEYALPFLEDGTVDVSGGYVSPLYEHLLHPRFGFSLSFVGLGFKNVPFPQCEVQSKYVAALLSGKAETPSQEAMEEWITNEARCHIFTPSLDMLVNESTLNARPVSQDTNTVHAG